MCCVVGRRDARSDIEKRAPMGQLRGMHSTFEVLSRGGEGGGVAAVTENKRKKPKDPPPMHYSVCLRTSEEKEQPFTVRYKGPDGKPLVLAWRARTMAEQMARGRRERKTSDYERK